MKYYSLTSHKGKKWERVLITYDISTQSGTQAHRCTITLILELTKKFIYKIFLYLKNILH